MAECVCFVLFSTQAQFLKPTILDTLSTEIWTKRYFKRFQILSDYDSETQDVLNQVTLSRD